MALVVYHYPNCSTCKKALGWLRANQIEHELVDIVNQPPARAVIERAAKLAGVPTRKLFNVAGESYRAGNFKDKLPGMTDAQAYAALAADGKLIKRPLAIGDGVALVGFDEAAWRAALK
ncbi:MAG TPA: Spx/MgsR family RNA polymerase-binding regulatory protein [Kofleriaceae bacterium]|nr:Spx/MgsR family RNA polymerase-binding regulatory protein [Kofleriaceae bacterium]